MQLLSKRIQELSESETLAMARKARELKVKGIDIISLSLGEPDFKTPGHICEAAKQAIDSGKYFAYSPVPGYPDLRDAIAQKLVKENGIQCSSENIIVSTGAKQSLANVMLSLLDPGDEVIVISPYWVTYSELVKLGGGIPVFVKGNIENDYKPTADQIKSAISSNTKLLIYSSPGNPTGSVFSQLELEQIAEVLKPHENIFVIADEIYEYINFSGKHASMAAIPGMQDNTITVNGFSKGFAMTGWRVGYISAPLWIAKACEKMQGQVTSGTNSIAQRAALVAYTSDMSATREMANAYLERRGMVYELLNAIPGLKNYLPHGAFYFFPDISYYLGKSFNNKIINNAGELSMYLLEEYHVSVVTGEAFGEPNNIRISYAASDDDLKEGIGRISQALSKLE